MKLSEFALLSKSFNFVSGEPYRTGMKECELIIGDHKETIQFYSYEHGELFSANEYMGMVACSKSFRFYVFLESNYIYVGGLILRVRMGAQVTQNGATPVSITVQDGYTEKVYTLEQYFSFGVDFDIYLDYSIPKYYYYSYYFGAFGKYRHPNNTLCRYSAQMAIADREPQWYISQLGYLPDNAAYYVRNNPVTSFYIEYCCKPNFNNILEKL